MALSFWLVVLRFTWLEIELAPGTSIFVYWLCMAPRWWATGFSVLSLVGTVLLEDSLCQRFPKTEELLNRATMEHTLLLTQAIAFIGAFILSVDIKWYCIMFCNKIYKNFPSYQAGKMDLEIRFFWFSPLLVFYFVSCMFLACLPWIQLYLYRETIETYNLSLVKLEEKLKRTATATDDHVDLIVPGCGFSPSERAKTGKQAQVSPLSEKRDGAPVLSGSEDPVENDGKLSSKDRRTEMAQTLEVRSPQELPRDLCSAISKRLKKSVMAALVNGSCCMTSFIHSRGRGWQPGRRLGQT